MTAPSIAIDIRASAPRSRFSSAAWRSARCCSSMRSTDSWTAIGPGPACRCDPRVRARALGVRRPPEGAVDLRAAPRAVPVADPGAAAWPLGAARDEKASRDRRRRGGILLPFVPMVVRTVQLAISGEELYGDLTAGTSLTTRLSNQLSQAGEVLHTQLPRSSSWPRSSSSPPWRSASGSTGFGRPARRRVRIHPLRGPRWRGCEPLLHPLDHARGARARAGRRAPRVGGRGRRRGAPDRRRGLSRPGARGLVLDWVDSERAQEGLVRQAEGRAAGGCPVAIVGLNVEFVQALPVLMPVAQEPPHGCAPGERFVALLDKGAPGTVTRPDNPVLAACSPDPAPVFDSSVGKILRCTA